MSIDKSNYLNPRIKQVNLAPSIEVVVVTVVDVKDETKKNFGVLKHIFSNIDSRQIERKIDER